MIKKKFTCRKNSSNEQNNSSNEQNNSLKEIVQKYM